MKKIPDPTQMKRIKGPRLAAREVRFAKVRITTYLDQEVLDLLRQLANDSGSKYQAVLNQVLRGALLGERQGLIARIARLEKAVFKTKAA